MGTLNKYLALLRGINVGGHHKVPMTELKKEFAALGFKNPVTLLNSGNVIFETAENDEEKLEGIISEHLRTVFGFPIPVLIASGKEILDLLNKDPFHNIEVTGDIRLYVSFLKAEPENKLKMPWISEDKAFKILEIRNKMVCSVLDLSDTKTTKAMISLERLFGKDITTRNWNSLRRIGEIMR